MGTYTALASVTTLETTEPVTLWSALASRILQTQKWFQKTSITSTKLVRPTSLATLIMAISVTLLLD